MKFALTDTMRYPMLLKCRTCGKTRGNHQAVRGNCPIGRLQQFQQFHATEFFRPRLPKIPSAVMRALTAFQESLPQAEWTAEQEYRRFLVYTEIAAKIDTDAQSINALENN